MRNAMLLCALVGFVACDGSGVGYHYQSTLYTNARGVGLHDGDGGAQVGMNGTTCEIDTSYAAVGSDYDYPGSNDTVEDVGTQNGDVVVVVKSDDGLHLQRPDGFWGAQSDDIDMPNVVEAKVIEDGVVAVQDDGTTCPVNWTGGDDDATAELPSEVCGGSLSLAVDPTLGFAYVTTPHGTFEATPDGDVVEVDEEPAELSAWDTKADVLYTASLGDTVVRGLESDGTVRWTSDVSAPITALAAMGNRGLAAVSVEAGAGTGEVVMLDGVTGEPVDSLALPAVAHDLKVSRDGLNIAAVEPGAVHFYDGQRTEFVDILGEILLEGL